MTITRIEALTFGVLDLDACIHFFGDLGLEQADAGAAGATFRTPEGQQVVRRLAQVSDVLVENFKVGGLAKYGLDYESLKAVNPRLVYCSVTGFGQTGPYSHRAGYDFIIQGMSGVMDLTGEKDGPPQKIGVAFADIFTGTYGIIAVMAALAQRERTGLGQHVDLSLLDSHGMILERHAATQSRLSNDNAMAADGYVVTDLTLVVDLGCLSNDSVPYAATINRRPGADLDVVMDDYPSSLGSFLLWDTGNVTKAVLPNMASRMDHDALPYKRMRD